jgi:hypothetical protein
MGNLFLFCFMCMLNCYFILDCFAFRYRPYNRSCVSYFVPILSPILWSTKSTSTWYSYASFGIHHTAPHKRIRLRPVDMHEDYLVAKIIRIKVSGDPTIYQTKGPFSTKQHRKIINIYRRHDLQEGHQNSCFCLHSRVLVQVPRKQ